MNDDCPSQNSKPHFFSLLSSPVPSRLQASMATTTTITWRALGKCRLLMNAVKVPAASKTKAVKKTKTETKTKTKTLGLMQPKLVSPILKDFLGGTSEICRADAIKKIWDYVKYNNLQNPNDKRQIICDQKLKTLFSGKETISMLEMSGLLSPHFVKTG